LSLFYANLLITTINGLNFMLAEGIKKLKVNKCNC